jgi:hypothetical protein
MARLRLLLLLGLRPLFLRLFGRKVMADGAARDGAQDGVMVRDMARNGTHHGAFQAALGLSGWCTRDQDGAQYCKNCDLPHGPLPWDAFVT